LSALADVAFAGDVGAVRPGPADVVAVDHGLHALPVDVVVAEKATKRKAIDISMQIRSTYVRCF
jgi:hypothetical protein